MPPRTRARTTKILKENIDVVDKTKVKASGKVSKKPRKPLGDKTNSLSDDNVSVDIPIKRTKTTTKRAEVKTQTADNKVRPCRERRPPVRFVGNNVLANLSKSKDGEITVPNTQSASKSPLVDIISDENTPKDNVLKNSCTQSSKQKVNSVTNTPDKSKTTSPFKTPTVSLDSSLITNRPKRICRLPSKFGDHSISTNKFIPVQPCHASTPKLQKKPANKEKVILEETLKPLTISKQKFSNKSTNKKSPDPNNNAKSKTTKSTVTKKLPSKQLNSTTSQSCSPIKRFITINSTKSPIKKLPNTVQKSDKKNNPKKSPTKRLINSSFSFRVLEDKPKDDNCDVYEFTYDPSEEPAPQKKKRKRVAKRKPSKPRTVVLKNNYDKNISKALETLKNKIKPGTLTIKEVNENVATETINQIVTKTVENTKPTAVNNVSYAPPLIPINETAKTSIHESNYASIRVEDIAADFVSDPVNHVELNYSPVNSPLRPETPDNQNFSVSHIDPLNLQQAINQSKQNTTLNKDPLNLQGDISFFDEVPVASSSMNVSVRHPHASPWRVEFGSLPIKWHPNTYVKPNMTPAVESSFIASEDQNKKKHVYTNLVPQPNESLPPIEENNTPNLIQSSIISFIKEVAERHANKKKRGRSTTPTKANSLFEDNNNTELPYKTPKKARKEKGLATPSNNNSHKSENTSKESNQSEQQIKNKDCTYFGFDDTEVADENLSPVKNKKQHDKVRALRPRARAVLQEINNQGPTRSILPANKKLANSEVVNQMYEQLKSAEDAPQFPDKEGIQGVTNDVVATNINDVDNEDDESVHLFEDIELIHHLKPLRKSYGKAKKVTFRQNSISDSDDTQQQEPAKVTDDEYDDLADLTYQMPNETKKKPKKRSKKQLTKKEEKEVEEWAAGFNSMCEEIDDFPLLVE